MSLFQRLRNMPLADVLHRGLLYSLVGVSGWGVYMMGAVHIDTLRRGREALAVHEAQVAATDSQDKIQADREIALAEAASNALSGSKKP